LIVPAASFDTVSDPEFVNPPISSAADASLHDFEREAGTLFPIGKHSVVDTAAQCCLPLEKKTAPSINRNNRGV
jgi:hypothetical protein